MDKVHGVDVDHEEDQDGKANRMDIVFKFGFDAAAQNQFQKNKEDASAIQCRERKQINKANTDGEDANQLKSEIGRFLRINRRG